MDSKFMRGLFWVFAVCMGFMAALFFPSFASLLFALGAFLIVPLPRVQDFLQSRGLHGRWRAWVALAVAFAAIISAPSDAPPLPEADEPPAVEAEAATRSLPAEAEAESSEDEASAAKSYEYDALQTLFMRLSADTTMDQFQTMVEESGLPYTTHEYNTMKNVRNEKGEVSYQVAYTKGAARQRYADSGDYLTASFGKTTSAIMTAQYVNTSALEYTALLYNFGNWFDFHGEPGYYVTSTSGNNKDVQYDSAEEVIQQIIDKCREQTVLDAEPEAETPPEEESEPDAEAAAEQARQEEEARLAAEEQARREEEARQAAEEQARREEEERKAAEEAAAEKARITAEEARRKLEENRAKAENFNTYYEPEQQRTTDAYVLNTSTKKIHYPTCRDVKKIAPKNYDTTNESVAELENRGYSPCGHCNPR